MKITLPITALAAILGLALVGAPISAQAQTPATTPAAPAKAAAPKKTSYKGTLTAIDATSATVKGTKETLTLAIAPTTKFEKDGKKATAADFAVGDAVTGSYTKDATGATTAASIHKGAGAKKDKKAAKSTTAPAAPAPAAPAAPAAQ